MPDSRHYWQARRKFHAAGAANKLPSSTPSQLALLKVTLLMRAGDIERNPGPQRSTRTGLRFAVWNIDSVFAREGCKIPIIETLATTFNYDLFGLCETYFTSPVTSDLSRVHGYDPEPLRADAPSSSNRPHGSVCLYYKNTLPIRERKDFPLLGETIVAELLIKKKKVLFVLSYRSPSQTPEEANTYFLGLEAFIRAPVDKKPKAIILASEFNARSPIFWKNDIENSPGNRLDDIAIANGLEQLINEPIP